MNKDFLIITIIIAIIAVGAGGFILGKYSDNIPAKVAEIEEEKSEVTEKETGKCASIKNISEKNQCWIELAKEEKDESHCKKISADFPEARGDCYTELAILKDDSLICEKIISGSLHKSCLEYFEGNDEKDEIADWKSYKNTKGNYQVEIPKDWKVEENIKEEKTSAGVGSSEIVSTSFTSPDFQKHWANNGALIYDSGAILNISVSAGKPVDSPDYCVKPDLEKIKAERYNKTDKELWKIDVNEFSCNWKTYYIFMICKTKNPVSYEQIFKQVLSSFAFIETDEISDWKTYKNEEYGFELKYPENWTIKKEDKFSTVNFINSDNITEKVVIIRQEDIPRVALDKKFIEDIVIDGISVKLYHDTDAKTGLEKIDKIIFDIPNSEDDFYIAGYGKTFNQILSTFRFTD